MVAARARGMYDDAAKQRKKRKPTDSVQVNLPEQNEQSRDAAGKALGVSGKSVDFATCVLNDKNRSHQSPRNELRRAKWCSATLAG